MDAAGKGGDCWRHHLVADQGAPDLVRHDAEGAAGIFRRPTRSRGIIARSAGARRGCRGTLPVGMMEEGNSELDGHTGGDGSQARSGNSALLVEGTIFGGVLRGHDVVAEVAA